MKPSTVIRRVDANQAEIVRCLRWAGATVQLLHTIGKGCPDALIGYQGKNYLAEIKSGGCTRLTDDEREWHESWRGQVAIVRTVADAMRLIGVE